MRGPYNFCHDPSGRDTRAVASARSPAHAKRLRATPSSGWQEHTETLTRLLRCGWLACGFAQFPKGCRLDHSANNLVSTATFSKARAAA